MVSGIQQKLTLMSMATSEPRPLQRQISQSPAPRVRFDDRDYTRRSPIPDISSNRLQESYRPILQSTNNRQFDRRQVFNNQSKYNDHPRSSFPGYTVRPPFQQAKQRMGYQLRSTFKCNLSNNQRMLFNARPSTTFSQSPRGNNYPKANDPATYINCGGKRHARQICPANNITCFLCGKLGHFQSVCLFARH